MANIADNAGIFVGRTLEIFNQMQVVVARDGDVAYAQKVLAEDMLRVITTTQDASASTTGSSVRKRPA